MADTPEQGTPSTPVNEPTEAMPSNRETKEERLLETTVNGKKVKVKETDLLRDYSKFSSANEKFQSAAELRKQNEAFEKRMVEDPESFLNDARIPKAKRREIAEKILMAELEEEMRPQLSQEQKELEELRKFKQSKEQEDEEVRTKAEQAEFDKIVQSRREVIAKTFQDALALSPLSKDQATSAEVVREMASYMRLCREAGHEVTPQELAKHVEDRFMNSYRGLTENMSGEDLVSFLGQSIIKKLREYDLGQLEARRGNGQPEQAQNWESKERSGKREYTDPNELLRNRRK